MKIGYVYLYRCLCHLDKPRRDETMNTKLSPIQQFLRFLLLLTLAFAALPTQAGSGLVVNRVELGKKQVDQLEQQLNTKLVPGRYWYDQRSGLWGKEGMPNAGQLPAGLPIKTPMPSDISGGGTGVWVNGREIHAQEYLYLLRVYGSVLPGRYFLEANGNAGFEGGPVAYNLFADARPKQKQHINWFSGGHNERGGSVIGGGGTVGFIGTDGNSVICEGGSCTFN